jgi:serine/threonine-protein kinase PpkA
MVATKLSQSLDQLRRAATAEDYAGYLESSLTMLDQFDTAENLVVQKWKNALRVAYLNEVVAVTKKATFEVAKNYRALTPEVVKRYIIEVFIKHQILGFRFRTLPLGSLEEHPNPYINTTVADEAKTRECDIIKTDTTLYLISPVTSVEHNPFSIRRFLREETMIAGGDFYINAAAIALGKQLQNEKYQEAITYLLSRIVKLQRQLSDNIVELVKSLNEYHEKELSPLLFGKLDADGKSVELSVTYRLSEYQKMIEENVLEPVHSALYEKADSADDYEYLFFSLRHLLIEMASEVRLFAGQSDAYWVQEANTLEYKILSLMHIMQKNKNEIFIPKNQKDPGKTSDMELLVKELKVPLKEMDREATALKNDLKDAIEESERDRNLFQKINEVFIKVEDPEAIRTQIEHVNRKCMLSIIKLLKRYPKVVVYLEFEDVVPVHEDMRHYALSQGDEGVTQLPIILKVSEDANLFDIRKAREILKC